MRFLAVVLTLLLGAPAMAQVQSGDVPGAAGMATNGSNATSAALANVISSAGSAAQAPQGPWTFLGSDLKLAGAGAGVATFLYANSANSRSITFPDPGGADSVAYLAAAQNFTGNNNFSNSLTNFGVSGSALIGVGNEIDVVGNSARGSIGCANNANTSSITGCSFYVFNGTNRLAGFDVNSANGVANSGQMVWWTTNGGTQSTALTVDYDKSATFAGLMKPTSSVGIQGTATNDNTQAGSVGEYVSSNIPNGSAVTLTSTGTSYNITSISLTAGDWDVQGLIQFNSAGTTSTGWVAAIGETSATQPTQADTIDSTHGPTTALNISAGSLTVEKLALPSARVSLSATTTIYLVGQMSFTGTSPTAFGWISARRRR